MERTAAGAGAFPVPVRAVALVGERPPAPTAATGGSGLLLGPGTDLLRESAVIPLRVMALAAALTVSPAAAQEFRLEEVPSVTAINPASLKVGTIAFSDHRADELADPATGLIPFAEWSRA